MAMIFGIVATRFRDLPQIISAALTVAFYITPVIWIKESLGDNELVEAIVSLNPLYHILQVMRLPLISQYPSLENWMWVVALGIALWTIGLLLFKKYEKRIAYWV
jgi:ABC-type polysaccharide/polyol phosphate export permease